MADLQEAINHINLLQQVLTPYANAEVESLSKAEKRVINLLLREATSIVQNINIQQARVGAINRRVRRAPEDFAVEAMDGVGEIILRPLFQMFDAAVRKGFANQA